MENFGAWNMKASRMKALEMTHHRQMLFNENGKRRILSRQTRASAEWSFSQARYAAWGLRNAPWNYSE